MPTSVQASSSRHLFLKQVGLAGLTSSLPARLAGWSCSAFASVVPSGWPAAVKNRAPLMQNAFYPLPLGALKQRCSAICFAAF